MQDFHEYLNEEHEELAEKILAESTCSCPCDGCKDGNRSERSCEDCECAGFSC